MKITNYVELKGTKFGVENCFSHFCTTDHSLSGVGGSWDQKKI